MGWKTLFAPGFPIERIPVSKQIERAGEFNCR